jgi:hypothetical protein
VDGVFLNNMFVLFNIMKLLIIFLLMSILLANTIEYFMCCRDKIKVCANRGYAKLDKCEQCCSQFKNISTYKECRHLCAST